jgi:probable rRNA maturation factor
MPVAAPTVMAPEGRRARQQRRPAARRSRAKGRGRPEPGERLRVVVGDDRGRPVPAPGLARWLAGVAPRRARGQVSVALVGDRLVRRLNREYRDQDYATDVLSFPNDDRVAGPKSVAPPTPDALPPAPYLGEIVIARGVARRQARAAGHSERVELRVLALHGLLHLLGFDHERDGGEMRRVEARLRRKGGLEQGLIERERPGAGRR